MSHPDRLLRRSLSARFALGTGIIMLPLVLLSLAGYFYFLQNLEATRLIVEQVYDRAMPISELQRELQRTESAIRGHLIDGSLATQEYAQMRATIEHAFAGLQSTISGDAAARLREAHDSWQNVDALSVGILDGTLTPAQKEAAYAEIAAGVRDSCSTLGTLYDGVHGLVFTQVVAAVDNHEQLVGLMRVLLVMALIVAVFASLMLMRSIIRPLRALKAGALRLGAGDLSYRIPVARPDEVGEVAAAFNAMANMLQQSQDELREMAIRDGLTGLLNHREFAGRLNRELTRAARHRRSFGVLVMDLDCFKGINDTHGHLVGDRLLQHVAGILQASLREHDVLCRHGGEEFAVIVVEAGIAEVLATAERLREAVETTPLALDSGAVVRSTLSIGAAVYPHDGDGREALFAQADRALYQAKHAGRNQVCYLGPAVDPAA